MLQVKDLVAHIKYIITQAAAAAADVTTDDAHVLVRHTNQLLDRCQAGTCV
jgi:hypothetical protein